MGDAKVVDTHVDNPNYNPALPRFSGYFSNTEDIYPVTVPELTRSFPALVALIFEFATPASLSRQKPSMPKLNRQNASRLRQTERGLAPVDANSCMRHAISEFFLPIC
jgi:hypothetical protein